MTMRLSHSSFTGTVRTLVAVGTVRLMSMFWAVRIGAPRSTVSCGSSLASDGGAGGVSFGTGADFLAGGRDSCLDSCLAADSLAADCFAAAAPFVSWADLADDVFVDDEAAEELADFVAGALSRTRAGALVRRASGGLADFAAGFFSAFVAGADFFAAGAEPLLPPADRVGAVLRAALEVGQPGAVDALGVLLVALEHLVDEPLVGTELRHRAARGAGLVVWTRFGHD